jgi:tetratricopeptide (TPR) repeat protein
LGAKITSYEEDEADDAADELVNSSLMRVLNRQHRQFQLHALMREEVRASCDAQELENLELRHAEALLAMSGRWRELGLRLCFSEVDLAGTFLIAKGDLQTALALYKKQEDLWVASGRKEFLPLTYWIEAQLLYRLQRFEEELMLLEKQETICLEVGDKETLLGGYPMRALALQALQRPEEALALLKKHEAISLELNDKEALLSAYLAYDTILKECGRTEEALIVLKKTEAICLELEDKTWLANCYARWGVLATDLGDRETAKGKLQRAVELFTELNRPNDRDPIQAMLNDL